MILFYSFMIAVGFPQTSKGYPLICPKAAERLLRTKSHCIDTNTSKYYCLLDDNEKVYTERCRSTEKLEKKGSKYVVRGGFDGEVCSVERYQPFIFNTSDSSDCVYQKSSCSEEGLIYFNNGSTTEDRQCRCDYTNGYASTSINSSRCYCIPSKEDCSCYKKHCDKPTRLSPDYECVTENRNVVFACPETNMKYWNHDTIHVMSLEEETEFSWLYWTARILVIVTLAGIMIAAAGILMAAAGNSVHEQNPTLCPRMPLIVTNEDEGSPIITKMEITGDSTCVTLTCKVRTICGITSVNWKKITNNDEELIKEIPNRYSFQENDEKQSLIIYNPNMRDTGTYKCLVENKWGSSESKEFSLCVPEIINDASKYSVMRGGTTRLLCPCDSYGSHEYKLPINKVVWKCLTDQREEVTDDLSLLIKNANSSLTYKCIVYNAIGSSESQEIMLEVEDLPEADMQGTDIPLSPGRPVESSSNECKADLPETDIPGTDTPLSPRRPIESSSNECKAVMVFSPMRLTFPPEPQAINKEYQRKSEKQTDEEIYGQVVVNAQVVLEGKAYENARKRLQEFLDEEIRVVLVGKAGVGKSATGNSILSFGKQTGNNKNSDFKIGCSANAVTEKTTQLNMSFEGQNFLIIDTPGIFSDQRKERKIETEIKRCIHLASPGLHAVIFVMECRRMTDEDRRAIDTFLRYFGENLKQFLVIVFTHTANLNENEGVSFKEWLENAKSGLDKADSLHALFEECKQRICTIDNKVEKHHKELEVRCILETIKNRKLVNGLRYYTDDNVKRAELNLQNRENMRVSKECEQQFSLSTNEFNTEEGLTKAERIANVEKNFNDKFIDLRKEFREKLIKLEAEKEILDKFELRQPNMDLEEK